eukprot:4287649-Karenia_brevis.AAC.1
MGTSSSGVSLEKQSLRREVSQLGETLGRQGDYAMDRVGDVENKAERMLAEQRLQFEMAARRYEQEARDVNQVEVAEERASVQSLKQSLINAEQ